MKDTWITLLLGALCMAVSAAEAQQPKRIPRIGFLGASSASADVVRLDPFRQGLRELGYVEGKNIVIEDKHGGAEPDRVRKLADELVHMSVDVIVTGGTVSAEAASSATKAIPIVMMNVSDPVAAGVAVSLARPGGNVTGLSTLAPEISAKQLELMKEILPRLSRVAVLGNSSNPGTAPALREVEHAAQAFGVRLQYLEVRGLKDIETSFQAASKAHADVILALTNTALSSHRPQLADLAAKSRIPVVFPSSEYEEDGGLLTYSVSNSELYRRAAVHVDKILKGAKPADLPIEQPTKFELVINMRTAKALGITIPQAVLVRADRVIE